MNSIRLDTSGLRDIRLDHNLPNSIYLDGDSFLLRLESLLQIYSAETFSFREKLIISLASNPAFYNTSWSNVPANFADTIISQADIIIEKMRK